MVIKKKRKLEKTEDKDDGPQEKKIKDILSDNIEEKKTKKIKNTDFDIKHFRKELKTKSCQTVALTQFLQICTKNSNAVDYLKSYLESGGNANEILHQLDEVNKKNPVVATPVFSLLHLLLLEIQSSHPHLLQAAEETCRYFLNSYVSTIDFMISEKSNVKQQKVTLKLLTAIVTINSELAFTILNQLSLQPKTLIHLVKNQGAKEKDDVRTSFLHFIMAFLLEGNAGLIKAVLDKQGLVGLIFPGLIKDNSELIIMILELLKNNIIQNINISKTIKIKTFNQNVILNIFNLFNWKGGSKKSDEYLNAKSEIEENVFNFLLILCTSHRLGIYFYDKTLGTSDVPTSQYLWRTIESLEAPWNNEKAGELIIKIVSSCPDLYKPVIHLVDQSFEPRNSEQWLKTISFLKKLLLALPAKEIIKNMNEMSSIQITNFVRNVYLPIPILKVSITAMNSKDNGIRNQIILLLHVMLFSIQAFLQTLNSKDHIKNNAIILLRTRLEDFIPKHFPSTDLLISVLHSMLDDFQTDGKELDSTDSFTLPLPTKSKILINVLDLLLLYNDILPNSLDPIAAMLDSKRMFEKTNLIDEAETGELKLKIVMFLIGADKFAFAPEKPLFKEILQAMFEIYLSSSVSNAEAAKTVLINIMETTGIFENSVTEILLLLSVIQATNSKYTNFILNIVEVIEMVIKKSDIYKSYLLTNRHSEHLEEELDSNLDIFFDNLESNNFDISEIYPICDKSCLSYFVIGLLDYLEKNKNEGFNYFINLYVINLLHLQESPEHLWNIVQNYKISTSLHEYVFSWKTKATSLSHILIEESTILYKLSNALLSEEKINLESIFNLITGNSSEEENETIVLDKYYHLNGIPESSVLFSCFNVILFNITQQCDLDCLTDVKISNSKYSLFCILFMTMKSNNSENIIKLMIENFLSHKKILKRFSPFKKQKQSSESYLTNFILDFITFCNQHKIEETLVDSLLKPYKRKVCLSLTVCINKLSTNTKCATLKNVNNILSIIGLNISDIQFIVREILKLDTIHMVSDENEPSFCINVLCYALNLFIYKNKTFSNRATQAIAVLYSKIITELNVTINIMEFEQGLFSYLVNNFEVVGSIPDNVFKAIFSIKHVSKYTSKLGAFLLKINSRLLHTFCKKVIQDEILQKRELVVPLTTVAFSYPQFCSNTDVLNKIYEHYKPNIQKILEKPHKASQIYIDNSEFIIKLVKHFMNINDCETYLKKSMKVEVAEIFHINILEEIFFKLMNESTNTSSIGNYFLCLLHLSNITLKKEPLQFDKLNTINECLFKLLLICQNIKEDNLYKSIRENVAWQNFFKLNLKCFLKTNSKDSEFQTLCENNCCLFGTLSSLINLIYPSDHPYLIDLFEMTSSHSEFLNIMLSNRYTHVKSQLVKLLLVLVHKNKSVMKAPHIPVYLSSYHASMKKNDRYILCLLKQYENNGLSMTEYQPYLWGDSAANYYAVRSKRTKSSLWSNPTANHILNLLDKEMIEKTIQNFPSTTKLNLEEEIFVEAEFLFSLTNNKLSTIIKNIVNEDVETEHKKDSIQYKVRVNQHLIVFKRMVNAEHSQNVMEPHSESEIYDPSFMLPLLNYIVSPGSTVSCHRIVRSGILAIPLVALSSDCTLVRGAAYNVLHRFYTLLESEMYYRNDRVLWSQFINTIKSSLGSVMPSAENEEVSTLSLPKLPGVAALYLARSALVMTHPLDPMFKPVNNFVISKQFINFSVVPDLLDLFHNTDIHFMERRTWILKLLRDSIKSFVDIKVLLKSVTFKIILDFYSSNLSDSKQKQLIFEVLNSSIFIPKAAKILVDSYGLFSWLGCTFRNINMENKTLISTGIGLVSNLWLSLASESLINIYNTLENDSTRMSVEINRSKCFKLNDNYQCQILFLLLDLLDKLSGININDIKAYLDIFQKISKPVLKNVKKAQIVTLVDVLAPFYDNNKLQRFFRSILENNKQDISNSSCVVAEIIRDIGDRHHIAKGIHNIVYNWTL